MFSFLDSIYSFNKDYLSLKSKTKVSERCLTGICLLLLWFGSGVAGIARAESNDGITEITGPVRLELGSARIIQNTLTFSPDLDSKYPELVVFPEGGIEVKDGGSLEIAGSPRVLLEMTSEMAHDLTVDYSYATYKYIILPHDYTLTHSNYTPILGTSLIVGEDGIFITSKGPEITDTSSIESKSTFVIFPKNRIISGDQSSRIVVYDGQTVENEGSVSFKNINSLDQKGGAIFVSSGGTLNLDSRAGGSEEIIVFQGNSAAYGGAIFVEGGNSIVTLKGSIKFEDNVDSGYGGAIYNYGGTLKFILGASDTIEFKNTQTGFDICDSSGAVYLNGVTGSIIKFSRGIGNILIPVEEEDDNPSDDPPDSSALNPSGEMVGQIGG